MTCGTAVPTFRPAHQTVSRVMSNGSYEQPRVMGGPLSDLRAWCCLGRIIAGSQAVEERQELVWRLVSSWRRLRGPGPVQCPLLVRQVAVEVGPDGGTAFPVTQPQRE